MKMKILSLGAGVQSSTILLMACRGQIERPDAVIFADTGWEPQAVYQWLEFLKVEAEKTRIPLYIVQQGNIKENALQGQVRGTVGDGAKKGGRWASMPYFTTDRKTGSAGMIRRQCTYEYKIRPIEKKLRELAGYKPRQRIPAGTIETWKGISIDELQRASLSPTKWISFYYPLIELKMNRYDCLNWFDKNGLPRPPRSACLGCPYKSNAEWRRLRDESPEEWNEVVEFDKAIRKCGGMRGDIFLHADRVPLDEVNLTIAEDHGQMNMFRTECQGICGV